MVSKDWTFEEALKEMPSRSASDPTLPLFQWVAVCKLGEYKKQFESDKYYLMAAIRVCANHGIPLPDWAASAYIKAYDEVNNARAKSWSKVFGDPYPKGRHLAAIRKKRELQFAVFNKITQTLAMEPSLPIDESLFEKVGKELNIEKTLASEYYYAAKKQTSANF
jgi:hypothetical protein